MPNLPPLRLLSCLCALLTGLPAVATVPPEPALDLSSVEGVHPRLFIDEDALETLRNRSWDPLGESFHRFFRQSGEEMLELEPVPYEYTGRRLLGQSRQVLKRVATWALLYRLEGDPRFRDRAIEEIETVVDFPTWNPSHFLDVGEMALAVAIGTDWLWADLTPEQRNRFLRALQEKALQPSLDEDDPDNWWIYYDNNWNQVCHAGLVASAIMTAELDPETAHYVIRRAIRAFPIALAAYQDSGAYSEGPVYWDYGTAFGVILLHLFEQAFGTTFGLDEDDAFRASGTYRAAVVTPSGRFYNYADCYATDRFSAATAWFASRYGDAAAAYEMRRGLKSYLDRREWAPDDGFGRLFPFVLLWYPEAGAEPLETADLPQLWLGQGPNPVALVRERWGDPEALFLGFKGNDGAVSHAHLDAGSFILEDEGVRWALDLGAQNYHSLERLGMGMWDRRQHSDRWRIFRLGPYSHNLLLIDERMQDADRKADITRFEKIGDRVEATVDLTPVHTDQVSHYERHFRLHDYRVLEIHDVIRGARERTERQGRAPATLHWRMVTGASVSVEGPRATLRQDGRTLHLLVQQPGDFHLRAAPLDPPPYFWDENNPGITAIDIWCRADNSGNQEVRVLMSTDEGALAMVAESPPGSASQPRQGGT